MYQHYDKDGMAVSLHDCYAEKAAFENGVLTFYFPDGFWIGADHKENSTGTTVRTDASEVRFQLEFGEAEDATVYVFMEGKPGEAIRKEWKLSKLLEGINSGTYRLEFLYQYRGYLQQNIDCWLWSEKKTYHMECELRLRVKDVTYCWNRVVENRTW
ncbi:MAG: hypothetical protein IJW37_03260 [Lachnospiraceae bacterium]|nr:hypothetical protein [Lachnospiraceae bacterium]